MRGGSGGGIPKQGIAIAERVYDQVGAMYETRRLPDLKVKWQDEPLEVWEMAEQWTALQVSVSTEGRDSVQTS